MTNTNIAKRLVNLRFEFDTTTTVEVGSQALPPNAGQVGRVRLPFSTLSLIGDLLPFTKTQRDQDGEHCHTCNDGREERVQVHRDGNNREDDRSYENADSDFGSKLRWGSIGFWGIGHASSIPCRDVKNRSVSPNAGTGCHPAARWPVTLPHVSGHLRLHPFVGTAVSVGLANAAVVNRLKETLVSRIVPLKTSKGTSKAIA